MPQHVPIWFSLARAYLAAGEPARARTWFQRIIESSERLYGPVTYVRSFYFLGKIHETSGDLERARRYYRSYYEAWKDGDLDRERIQEVQAKLFDE